MTDLFHTIEESGNQADDLGAILVERGLVANKFILDLNRTLTVPHDMELPYPWNLPSRMFRFPIEVTDANDGPRKIGLMHPLLVDHPFVQHVQTILGIELDPNGAPNEYGYRSGQYGEWWHAVDLVTAGKWKELLETERFTTPDDIAGAVSFGLQSSPHEGKKRNGYLNTIEARKILAHLESAEPVNRADSLHLLMTPRSLKEEKGAERWPINMASRGMAADTAWCLLVGIEAGWFKHDRSGFLQWTQAGRDRYHSTVGISDGFNAEAADRWRPPDIEVADEEPTSDEEPSAPKAIQLDLFG